MREVVWFLNHVLSTPSQINNLHYFSCSACKAEHTDVCLSAFPVQHTNIFLPQRTRSLTQCLSKQTLFIITEHSCNSDFIYIAFLQWVKPHIHGRNAMSLIHLRKRMENYSCCFKGFRGLQRWLLQHAWPNCTSLKYSNILEYIYL